MRHFGSLAIVATLVSFAGFGCVATTADGPETGGDTGGDTAPGTDTGGSDAGDDTAPPTDGGPDEPGIGYPDPGGDTLVRFVVAASELDFADFDICYRQDVTALYAKPFGKGMGGKFKAPEVTKYFKVEAGKPLQLRIVQASLDSCDATAKFKDKDGVALGIEDSTVPISAGWNTAVIYKSPKVATLALSVTPDPTAVPVAPTLQFFHGIVGLGSITVKVGDAGGKEYPFSIPADFGKYLVLPFGATYDKPIDVTKITFDVGGIPFPFDITGYKIAKSYYWIFAYGAKDKPQAYVCPFSADRAGSGDVTVSGCSLR